MISLLTSINRIALTPFFVLFLTYLPSQGQATGSNGNTEAQWVSALDKKQVKQTGDWYETSFLHAAKPHLHTTSDGSSLEFSFKGTAIAIRLGNHAVPAYGPPNRGSLLVSIDGELKNIVRPIETGREITIARGLENKRHRLRIEHRSSGSDTGCRIEAFGPIERSSGDLLFNLIGEENAFFVDARALVRKDERIVRDTLVRNWLTGQCSLAGLTPGKRYSLEIQAVGWQTAHIDDITILAGTSNEIEPVFLNRKPDTVITRFRFPALNRPAIRKPGQSFRARFLGYQAEIDTVTLIRKVGPAVISRNLEFKEDIQAAHYYDREIIAKLPADMPPGAYDLTIQVSDKSPGGRRTGICRSARSVHVVSNFPDNPVLVTFGHLDTAGQNQAEYLERLASLVNLLAPDLVLDSTAVNPAYISGALSKLDMPYLINFGNHQFYGHEKWYGDPVGLIHFGPHISVLNFGHPWHEDRTKADALLLSHPDSRYKIINAFEANAPIDWLNKHRIRMIHFAHGPEEKNADIGTTPTRRIGKVNASSFRVVRLRDGQVESSTYDGHKTAPIPFNREETPPLRVRFEPENDGSHDQITAIVTNDYVENYPQCRLTFVLPKAQYEVNQGEIESSIVSDNQKYIILSVRINLKAKSSTAVKVQLRR